MLASGRGVPRGETRRRSGFPFWGARKIAEYLAHLFDNKNVYRTLVTKSIVFLIDLYAVLLNQDEFPIKLDPDPDRINTLMNTNYDQSDFNDIWTNEDDFFIGPLQSDGSL